MVLYTTLSHPQAVLRLLTKELCVVQPYGSSEMLLLLSCYRCCCSYTEETQQFHHVCYLPACFGLLNMLFVVLLVLIAYLHGYFLYFSYLWWRVFRQQQTGTLQKILKSHGSETPPPLPLFLLYAIILLKNLLINVFLVGVMSELIAMLWIPAY